MIAGCCAYLLGLGVSHASQVPQALSSQGPVFATFNNLLFLAWAGLSGETSHKVGFETYDGSWSPQTILPGVMTTTAPALGATAQAIYLAITPPSSGGEIEFYRFNGSTFELQKPLCNQSCAVTLAAPALAGDGTTLYAAWTTANGAIMYAQFINDVWFIASQPIPNAVANPNTAPSLAVFGNQLFVAWTPPTGGSVSITSATLPLSSTPFDGQTIAVSAQTNLAPSLGVIDSFADDVVTPELYLSWTTTSSGIDFAHWKPHPGEWVPADSPVPLPAGATTHFPVATNTVCFNIPGDNASLQVNIVGYTTPPGDIDYGHTPHKYRMKACP
jgi:hypothetical protein